MTNEQLKAKAYDLLVSIEQAQSELRKVNEELYHMNQVPEETTNQPEEEPKDSGTPKE